MELFISDLDGTLLNGNAEVTEFKRAWFRTFYVLGFR